jgi:hypothetical protein
MDATVHGHDQLGTCLEKILEWQAGTKEEVHIAIAHAISQFITDAEVRNLAPVTVYKYRFTLEKRFKPFCDARNLDQSDPHSPGKAEGRRFLHGMQNSPVGTG